MKVKPGLGIFTPPGHKIHRAHSTAPEARMGHTKKSNSVILDGSIHR